MRPEPKVGNRQSSRRIDNVSTMGDIITNRDLSMPTSTRRKDDVIQIRASAEAKAILNRAAALRGQKLSEFMLESARRQAEDTLLDQRMFFLDDAPHARFLTLLAGEPARLTLAAGGVRVEIGGRTDVLDSSAW